MEKLPTDEQTKSSRRRLASSSLRSFSWVDLPSELVSAIVVTLVLIPSAIAYADLAHLPPIAGLYAALGGMVVFALFTSSRHVITGPDAALALMVGATVSSLAGTDPAKAMAISTWLAFFTGALLLLAAWLKMGAAADLLAKPVMLGFMNGAAVVIIISQLGKLSGIALHEDNSLLRLYEWASRLAESHGPTLGIGLCFIVFLIVLQRAWPHCPGAIVVFTLAMVAGHLIDMQHYGEAVIGPVDTRFPDPVPPQLTISDVATLMVSALGMAFLIFPEGIVLGRSVAARHGYRINPDRELLALGCANLAAGLLRSFAVGASQTRTLLNDATGGRSQVVSLISAVLLVAFLYFLAGLIASLPTAAIAAILVFTGFTLLELTAVSRLWRIQRTDASVAIVTSLGVIAIGVLPGIMLGVFLSLGRLLVHLSRPHDALLGRINGFDTLHDVGNDERARTIPGLVIYRFYGPLVFSNVRYFIDRIEHFLAREQSPVRQVILDARAVPEIDVTAADEVNRFVAILRDRGIGFTVAKAHLPLREAAAKLGMSDWLPNSEWSDHLEATVAKYEEFSASDRETWPRSTTV